MNCPRTAEFINVSSALFDNAGNRKLEHRGKVVLSVEVCGVTQGSESAEIDIYRLIYLSVLDALKGKSLAL
jgi:hypothetical protein